MYDVVDDGFWGIPEGTPSDDGNGEYDSSEGCSYCGFWQCAGDCDD